MNIFPVAYGTSDATYGLNASGNASNESTLFQRLAGGNLDWKDAFSIFFFNVDNSDSVILGLLIFTGFALVAWLTHSPAPFVVGFILNVMINLYRASSPVFEQFTTNNYLMLIGLVGMVILFMLTVAETLTHGDV
jgi:hypothetical protein